MGKIVDKIKRSPKIVLIVGAYVLIAAVVVVIAVVASRNNADTAMITNYNEIVKNLPDEERDRILSTLTYTLELNTDTEPSEIMDITIRNNSYQQTFEEEIYNTSFIVDIASLQQSYKIVDSYSSLGAEKVGVDYKRQVRCIFGDEQIYGDFRCKDRISVENALPWADPIQYELPYQSTYYQISVRGGISKVGLTIRINMPEPTRENNIKAAEYYKELALQKIRDMGYGPDNYEITYTWLN